MLSWKVWPNDNFFPKPSPHVERPSRLICEVLHYEAEEVGDLRISAFQPCKEPKGPVTGRTDHQNTVVERGRSKEGG